MSHREAFSVQRSTSSVSSRTSLVTDKCAVNMSINEWGPLLRIIPSKVPVLIGSVKQDAAGADLWSGSHLHCLYLSQ